MTAIDAPETAASLRCGCGHVLHGLGGFGPCDNDECMCPGWHPPPPHDSPEAPAPDQSRQERRKGRRKPAGRGRAVARRAGGRAKRRLKLVWGWLRRKWAPDHMPGPYRSRRLALTRQTVAWVLIGVALATSGLAYRRSGHRLVVPTFAEGDRGSAAADWAAVSWRDAAGLGITPRPVGLLNTGGGYYRVTLDRGDAAGCVQFGVIDNGTSFRFAGEYPAPVACPAPQTARPAVGDDATGEIRTFAERFAADYLAGRPLDLYAAPGVTLVGPVPATVHRVESVKDRLVEGDHDLTVTVTADQGAGPTRLAFRIIVQSRSGKLEVREVKGGGFVTVDALDDQPTVLSIPPVATTVAGTASKATTPTSGAAGAATATTAPPPVTTAPGATVPTTTQPSPVPANAGA